MNKNIVFDSAGDGTCPKCKKRIHYACTQYVKHYQCETNVEVCTDCKSEFIRLNDIFFRGIL